jgi:methionyl-tRNA formyltransferase
LSLRVVFMGSPQFAVPALRALHRNFYVVGVVTQPDKPRGRGRKSLPTDVKAASVGWGLPVAEPHSLSDPDTLRLLEKWAPDTIVVVAYGKILPQTILDLPPRGCVNLHASLLPRHRGAAPISAAILAGDEMTGVTTIAMDAGMDTGDILLQREIPIRPEDTAGTLHDKLLEPGADLVVETLAGMAAGTIVRVPQDHSKATYTRLLSKRDGRLDWDRDAEYLSRLVRAVNPWPGAFFELDDQAIKVWSAASESGTGVPGKVEALRPDGIVVAAGEGLLVLKEVQAPGKKRVGAAELARGRRLEVGSCLA